MEFQQALQAQFKFRSDPLRDNLPALAMPRYKRGPDGDRGRRSLAAMLRDMEARSGAEIGTFRGDSAVMWCRAAPQLHLTCVDPYQAYQARPSQDGQDEMYEQAKQRLSAFNVTLLRAASLDVVDNFADGQFDFVYIDGDHRFDPVMQDLIRWARKVRKGGIVMLHDYAAFYRAGVRHAVDAYTDCHRIQPWFITQDRLPTAFWEKGVERA